MPPQPPPDDRPSRRRGGARTPANIRLVVEYVGTAFEGWEERAGARAAGGVLRGALARVLGHAVTVVSAARPEPGVHVEGLAVNFLTRSGLEPESILEGLNRELPDELAVVRADAVAPRFHARKAARSHVYRYHLATRPSVFHRDRAWHPTGTVSHRRLAAATRRFVGLHDFASFCPGDLPEHVPTKAKVRHAGWKQGRDLLVFRLAASHFPPGMPLRAVGALVAVASGALPSSSLARWLKRPEPGACHRSAPPWALYLERVEYEKSEESEPRPRAAETSPTARRAVEALERGER